MLALELQRYLHEHIPLTRAMAVSVVSLEPECVVLGAPLAPNINHRDTVFGGSAAALAILAGWCLLHVRLDVARVANRLVIQRNTMEYEQPIVGDFTARAHLTDAERWRRFTNMLSRRGRSRIVIDSLLECAGQRVALCSGEFVAFAPRQG